MAELIIKSITHGQRFSILWIVNQIPGVNKLEAKMIQFIRTNLQAQEVETPPADPKKTWGYDPLDSSQRELVRQALDAMWEQKKIPAALSANMLELDEVLTEV